MKQCQILNRFLLPIAAVTLAGIGTLAGCNTTPAHPDYKSAVTNSLSSNRLTEIRVSQDQEKG
jgi:hypothetical protein